MATRKTKKKSAKKTTRKKVGRKAPVAFTLGAEPGIRDVAELYGQLAKRADEPKRVIIDASGVARIDTAVMQLLLAFVVDRRRRELEVAWKAPSETFLQVAEILDLERHLGCGETAGG